MPKETFLRLRDEKQDAVLRSAIREFNKHGFERARVCDIAKNAGVATGSIYQYFEDKDELFAYCAGWSLEVFMEKLDRRANIKGMDIFEYFRDDISKKDVDDEERELVIFMQVLSKYPDLIQEAMRAAYQKTSEYIMALIQNTKDKGLLRADMSNEILMEYFVAVTERFKARWMERNVDFTTMLLNNSAFKKEVNQMIELLKNGMGRSPQKNFF